jgi:nucleotide-binding universal stress UspA family protein
MKILIGYDGTEPAKKALDVAIEMAKAFNACISILNSVSDSDNAKETFEFIEDEKHKIIEKAENNLEEAGRMVEKTGIPFETHLLNRGLKPGADIVGYAEEANADFIVIGIHKKSKVGKLLFGSTAQYIILNAHCTVVAGR